MKESPAMVFMRDDFGRRSGLDRRQNRESLPHNEERRDIERRKQNRRASSDRRSGMERRRQHSETSGVFWSISDPGSLIPSKGFPVCVVGPDRRNGKERRSGVDRRDFMIL
jgi:hypothetical protein